MNGIVAEGLKWVGASVAALTSIALFSMAPPNDDMYPTPYATDPNFLELREPRDPRRRWRKREPRVCYVENDEEPEDWAEERRSFNANQLAKHGLKVCDYAFERKLPPVPKAQLKRKEKRKSPQPLKRTRDALDWDSLPIAGPSSQGASATEESRAAKRARLERRPTEPMPASQEMRLSRISGFGSGPAGPSGQRQAKPAPPSTMPAPPSNAIPTPPITPSPASSRARVASSSKSRVDTPLSTPRATPRALPREPADVPMDVDEPPASRAPASSWSLTDLPIDDTMLARHLQGSLSQCSSLTSLASLAPGRRSSLRDISSVYNVSPQPAASAPPHAPRGRSSKPKSKSGTPAKSASSSSRGASPTGRQAGASATRKTRSSAAKKAAGTPKDAPRRSLRTKRKQAARL
ncbi:hypothetical protein PsYK624_004450 [Phanerochaete sordida]|uniref:Uncharacterized protein n=1 Tax=Phanerochaete sordida TaxID=48140 RepID=A0A9P3L7D1_9APHY|nr:hypothetical protein PsYK624_004450 [Phanerochaete sordida]